MAGPRDPLENLRKRAKDLLRAVRGGNPEAMARARKTHHRFADAPSFEGFRLADAQFVIAREKGFQSWPKMAAAPEHVVKFEPRRPSLAKHTPYETVLALVKTEEFRTAPEETLRKHLHPKHDEPYLGDILSHVERDPSLLGPGDPDTWDGILCEIYFPPDCGEYLPEGD